jgi:AhpD family alkylhydroperoxidase
MTADAKDCLEKARSDMSKLKEQAPDVVSGFSGLFAKVMKAGALSVHQKELIAVGISVNQRCGPCINAHVKKCLDAGAGKEQILEAAGVAVMMGGGPAYTHLPLVVDAIEALQA